jgi:mitogen-activated protein kinase organizer 1
VATDPVTSLTPTKQSDTLLLSTLNSKLLLLDKSTGKVLQSYKNPAFANETYRIRSTLGMNDSVVISGSEDGRVYVWDLVDGKVLHTLGHAQTAGSAKKDVVSAVAFCDSRREWCSAGGDGEVVVWAIDGSRAG